MQQPLSGVKVLDLSRVLAGPLAAMTLGDLGAQVLKVERPGTGDDTRGWGPPFADDGQSAYFRAANRNKWSIALDFDRGGRSQLPAGAHARRRCGHRKLPAGSPGAKRDRCSRDAAALPAADLVHDLRVRRRQRPAGIRFRRAGGVGVDGDHRSGGWGAAQGRRGARRCRGRQGCRGGGPGGAAGPRASRARRASPAQSPCRPRPWPRS